MRILPPIIEQVAEDESFARYSNQAVRNMFDAAVTRRAQLILHQARMDCWIDMEYDLYLLLKLGERWEHVDRNLAELDMRIRELRAELMKRRLREMA